MKNRGQVAYDFLMTYGWAILASVVAIGFFAYFGVFSPPEDSNETNQSNLTINEYNGNLSAVYGSFAISADSGVGVYNPDWIAEFSSDYNNITINGEICKVVTCECAKKNPACMSICYYCEEKNGTKTN